MNVQLLIDRDCQSPQRASIIWLVMKETLFLLVIGLVVGVPRLWRWADTFPPNSTESRAAIHGLPFRQFLCWVPVAAAAGMIPAHRASRIEPMLALRFE
jgi:hypothetical protein